jgi:sulfur carrier protein ThiS
LFSMDRTLYVRLYEELNDYLPEEKRKRPFNLSLKGPTTVKETMRLLGVPSEEVDLVLVNGESVPFTHIVQDQDRISIYPIFESLDISTVTRLRDRSLLAIKLGKEAKDLSTKKSTLKGDANGQKKD